MSSKPSIPKGTRDFSTGDMLKREYIFETIKQVFRLYSYQPIETPAMENLTTLLGKYGDEGDKLLFRILNSGDYLSAVDDKELAARDTGKLSSKICEKGLRFDLTVPFARFVVQHRDELIFPFKRYQIQPVWRADRPQKGRYREFFQCDADVIGSDSLLNEVELIQIIDDVFSRLKVKVRIKLNNRKILAGIAEYAGMPEKLTDITVALDKYEKVGWESVKAEMADKGINDNVITEFGSIVNVIDKDNSQKTEFLRSILIDSQIGIQGLQELEKLLDLLQKAGIKSEVIFDLTLARGLNYYTGAIIEVKSADVSIGSICGGGRYDNLTGVFGMAGVSGVGISFGADRIYDVISQLCLFDENMASSTEVLLLNSGDNDLWYLFDILNRLRNYNVRTELYPDYSKIKKQKTYAGSKKIPFIIFLEEGDIANKVFTFRNMTSGVEEKVKLSAIDLFIKEEVNSSTFER